MERLEHTGGDKSDTGQGYPGWNEVAFDAGIDEDYRKVPELPEGDLRPVLHVRKQKLHQRRWWQNFLLLP